MKGPSAALTIFLACSSFQSGSCEDPKSLNESLGEVTDMDVAEELVGEQLIRARRATDSLAQIHVGYLKMEGAWTSGKDMRETVIQHGGYVFEKNVKDLAVIARVHLQNCVLPAQYRKVSKTCHIGLFGKYYGCGGSTNKVEYLITEDFYWDDRHGGDISNGAVIGGISTNYEQLYFCRFYEPGSKEYGILHGTLAPSHGKCTVAWIGGKVLERANYSVLKYKKMSNR